MLGRRAGTYCLSERMLCCCSSATRRCKQGYSFRNQAYSDVATGCVFYPNSLRVVLNVYSTQVNCSSSQSCLCSAGIRPTCDVQDGSAPHTSSSNGCACPFLAGSTSAYCKTGQYCYGGICADAPIVSPIWSTLTAGRCEDVVGRTSVLDVHSCEVGFKAVNQDVGRQIERFS